MQLISEDTISLNRQAQTKEEAIKQAGELLHNAGYVSPDYLQGMLEREKVTSTYLDNGIAIPHGRHDSISDVYHTGICVLQYPEGVEWEPETRVNLVIGIAATSNDHMDILMSVAEIAEDPELVKQMVNAKDPSVILNRLNSASK